MQNGTNIQNDTSEQSDVDEQSGSICVNNVAEAGQYTLVNHLEIPENSDYNNDLVAYALDNSADISGYDCVAYCLELDDEALVAGIDGQKSSVLLFRNFPESIGQSSGQDFPG